MCHVMTEVKFYLRSVEFLGPREDTTGEPSTGVKDHEYVMG